MEKLLWRDRELRFDVSPSLLQNFSRGEVEVDALNDVEDTKGNNGQHGRLVATNLRLIFYLQKMMRINISIGLACIDAIEIRNTDSRLLGSVRALYVTAKFNKKKYQFIFTNLVKHSPRLYASVLAVQRAYATSTIYRDVVLRGPCVQQRELVLLPGEEVVDRIDGCWNLANDQGVLGFLFVTNIRCVWFSKSSEAFNVSVPYYHATQAFIRESKFGAALVLCTSIASGDMALGFRIDPRERLTAVRDIVALAWRRYLDAPILGVTFERESAVAADYSPADAAAVHADDDLEIETAATDTFAAYFADDAHGEARPPVFNQELELAVEQLHGNDTLAQLWAVT